MIDHQKLRIKEVKVLSVVTMKILIIGNSSMTNKDKLICGVYGLIALVALPATWINNIAFMTQPTNSSAIDFMRSAYANAASASLSNDLFLLALAACIFMAIEGKRVGVRYVWLYILLSAIIAISVTFPLFLISRHLKLSASEQNLAS
jgi:Terpene cyclase DEP1